MRYLLSIDPGLSTGIALLSYESHSAPELVGSWQFTGGAEALDKWFDGEWEGSGWGDRIAYVSIAEKFNARNTRGFSYTTSALEPLRCEGVLISHGHPGAWVQPSRQYLVGGKDLSDKKKRQHQFLKDIGFYQTGKDFGAPDADDFRSAAAHGLAYLARELRHKATFHLLQDWTENAQ